MILVRNVFRCKPGQAKALVKMFKETAASGMMGKNRVLTDLSSTFWTVVLETEAETLEAWEKQFAAMSQQPDARKAMEGYMDLVEGGHREIFKIE